MDEVKWQAVLQEYRDHKGIRQDIDPRRYGALFVAQLPGGFLFKAVTDEGASIAFVPRSKETEAIEMYFPSENQYPPREYIPMVAKALGMDAAAQERQATEEWLLRFHDEVQPNRSDRERARQKLVDELLDLHGKHGIETQRATDYRSVLVSIIGQGPATVSYENDGFVVVAEGTKPRKVRVAYDPVSRTYRGSGQDAPPAIPVLMKEVWRAIQKKESAD
jgi:hypothetical protein